MAWSQSHTLASRRCLANLQGWIPKLWANPWEWTPEEQIGLPGHKHLSRFRKRKYSIVLPLCFRVKSIVIWLSLHHERALRLTSGNGDGHCRNGPSRQPQPPGCHLGCILGPSSVTWRSTTSHFTSHFVYHNEISHCTLQRRKGVAADFWAF